MQKKLQIVHLLKNLHIGGMEKIVYEICRLADANRFRMALCCTETAGNYLDDFLNLGIQVYVSSRNKQNLIEFLRRFDLVHIHWTEGGLYRYELAQQAGKKIVETIQIPFRRPGKIVTDATVCVSRDTASKQCHSSTVIYNAVDTSLFIPVDRTNRDGEIIKIVTICSPSKLTPYFTESMLEVLDTASNVHLYFVGPNQKSTERVVFHGLQRSVIPFLQEVDIFAYVYPVDGLSVAILEAMSAGLPCVIADIPSNREIFPRGVENGGILVPLNNPLEVARSCLMLIKEKELRLKLGEAARSRVVSHFDVVQMVKAYEEIYEALASD